MISLYHDRSLTNLYAYCPLTLTLLTAVGSVAVGQFYVDGRARPQTMALLLFVAYSRPFLTIRGDLVSVIVEFFIRR